MDRTDLTRAVVRRLLASPSRRGSAADDGEPTLLTVNYRSDGDVRRLVRSYRRFVSASGPVVVVANTPVRVAGTRTVTAGANLHHGLGLDFGMRFVRTEYVVICDPDSIVVDERFWPLLKERVDAFGAASIDIGSHEYHPICLSFRTDLWKRSRLSLREDWTRGHDVAGQVTHAVGGLHEGALLRRTHSAGPAIASSRPGRHHFPAEVYERAFSNSLGASRATQGPSAFGPEEGEYDVLVDHHRRWRAWADAFLDGRASLAEFSL